MAQATKTAGGGSSYASATVTVGQCPRVANGVTDMEDSPYGSIELSITSAEALALRATPKLLVAAPGSTKVLQFLGATIVYKYVAAYTESAANLVIENATGTDLSEILETTGFVDATSNQIRHMVPAILGPVMLPNEGLYLKNNGAAEWSGGTSTFNVRILYAIHATGL